MEERQNTTTLLPRAELLVEMFDQKRTPSNTSSNKKCWTNIIQHGWPNGRTMFDRANPTLFDSLATALASLKSIHQITLINNNFKKTQIGSTARLAIKFALILSYFGDCKFALDRVQLLNRIRCRETNALRIIDRNNFN